MTEAAGVCDHHVVHLVSVLTHNAGLCIVHLFRQLVADTDVGCVSMRESRNILPTQLLFSISALDGIVYRMDETVSLVCSGASSLLLKAAIRGPR